MTYDAVEQIVGRERRERVSQLVRCGEGCFDSRRRVNSIVGRISNLKHSLRTLFIFAFFASLFYGATVLAQGGNSDRCEVISLDVTGKKPAQWEHLQGKQLGTFDTVIAEEQLTTKMTNSVRRGQA